jgi:hypothetical protein
VEPQTRNLFAFPGLRVHDTGIHYSAVTTPRFVDSAFALLADLEYLITPPSYWWICDPASSASLCLVRTSHKVLLTGRLQSVWLHLPQPLSATSDNFLVTVSETR